MNFTFETQDTNTYLVYKIGQNDNLDSLSIGMVSNNRIKGIAPIHFTQMNEDKFLKYNISAKVSVKQFFTGTVNKKRLLGVFSGISSSIISAEEYMIDASNFILDLDYIFVDVTSCETLMVCLPIADTERETVQMSSFFKSIVFSTQFDQTENSDYVAKIISYLNGNPSFSIKEFKIMIDDLINTNIETNKHQSSQKQPVIEKTTVNTMQAQPITKQSQSITHSNNQDVHGTQTKSSLQQQVQNNQQLQSHNTNIPNKTSSEIIKPAFSEVSKNKETPRQSAETNQKKISMFHLFMHYTKENKEAYMSQKQMQKEGKTSSNKQNANQANRNVVVQNNTGFAVPGQASSTINNQNKSEAHSSNIQNTSVQSNAQKQQQQVVQRQIVKQEIQQNSQTSEYQQSAKQDIVQPVITTKNANFGDTVVLNNATNGLTSVLSTSQIAQATLPHLVRSKNNERINLDKPVFRIGKEKSYVDYFISDNTAISRSHSNIIIREGECFIADMNSTNHTFVNGVMVQANEEMKLTHGDKLKLANEEFEFRVF